MLSLRSEAFILQSAVRAQDRTEWTGHINSHRGIVTILPNVLGSFPPLFLLRAERIRRKNTFPNSVNETSFLFWILYWNIKLSMKR